MSLSDYESIRKSRKNPAHLKLSYRIWGEVQRPGMSYRVQLAWDGVRLSGRLGGAIFGENVYLETSRNQILGSVASTARVFTLYARREGEHLEVRLVGAEGVSTATLRLSSNRAAGQIYLSGAVHPVEIQLDPARLTARIGKDPEAQEVTLTHGNFPGWVLAIAALAADVAARNSWRALLDSYIGWAEA